jgi:hypothetical protein
MSLQGENIKNILRISLSCQRTEVRNLALREPLLCDFVLPLNSHFGLGLIYFETGKRKEKSNFKSLDSAVRESLEASEFSMCISPRAQAAPQLAQRNVRHRKRLEKRLQ